MKWIFVSLVYCQLAFTPNSYAQTSKKPKKHITYKNYNKTKTTEEFVCDGRQHCSEMTSYAEAVFFLKYCPNVKMDGDNDKLPCERQAKRNLWAPKSKNN